MGRAVRMLLRVPAIRRVMLRLANAEAAIAEQQGKLGALNSAVTDHYVKLGGLDERFDRLNADGGRQRAIFETRFNEAVAAQKGALAKLDDHVAEIEAILDALHTRLADVAGHMPPERRTALEGQVDALNGMMAVQRTALGEAIGQISQLFADHDALHTRLADVAGHMPPDRRTALEGQVDALNEMMPVQQTGLSEAIGRIAQLSADRDALRAQLAEVAGHMPPGQRSNLEATLHGQQLQLGALNSTIHANQIQLGALNDIAQRLSAESAGQRTLLADLSARAQPNGLASLETMIAEQQDPDWRAVRPSNSSVPPRRRNRSSSKRSPRWSARTGCSRLATARPSRSLRPKERSRAAPPIASTISCPSARRRRSPRRACRRSSLFMCRRPAERR